jgi:hypothetical protein
MSYILDALRKAAEQRGSTTSVLFRPAPVQPGVARSWRMPWIVVGGLLALNVVVLAWTFRPSGAPDAPPTASESSASPGVVMAPPPVASAPAPAVPSAPSAALPSTAAAVAPPPSVAGPAVAPAQRPADLVPPSHAPVVGPTPKTVPSPSRQRATASRAVPTEPPAIGSAWPSMPPIAVPERPSAPPTAVPERPGVPPTAVPERPAIPSAVEPPSSPRSRAERRAGVIQTMPPQPAAPSPSAKATGSRDALKLEVVSYSDTPAQRLVFISGRKYVEGDTTEGGFRVEHIKEDSVVLSDQGERFTLR